MSRTCKATTSEVPGCDPGWAERAFEVLAGC